MNVPLQSKIVPIHPERHQNVNTKGRNELKLMTRKAPSSNEVIRYPAGTTTTTTTTTTHQISKSIPISKNLKRTPSEVQLLEDEAMADYRDYCMYTRIVNGIIEQYNHHQAMTNKIADERVVASIMRTRQLPVKDSPSYLDDVCYSREESPIEAACRITAYHQPWQLEELTIPPSPFLDDHDDDGIFIMDL